jgi:hypothetical protein
VFYINDPKAAIDAITVLLDIAAMPVPVRFIKPAAKISSSHVKFNLFTSVDWLNQVFSTLNSSLRKTKQRNPKKIKDGNIRACKLEDSWGTKKAKGAQTTLIVMDREAIGAKMPILVT